MKSWESVRPDRLAFPIRDKVYTVPELDYRSMLLIQKVKAGEKTELDDAPPEQTWRVILGGAYDEMVADNVPAEALGRAGLAALAYFEQGLEVAEAVWENGLDPKALAAAIETRTESPSPSSTAEERKTPSPASMSGTSSRPAGSRKTRTKAATPS